MKPKFLSIVKMVFYVLCFSSLFLPMSYNGHVNEVVFGFNYIIDLMHVGEIKEELYWFFYYFIIFILPPAIEIVFWFLSKKKIVSNVFDIILGTGSSVVMFCFFVTFKKSPIGIFVAMLCQIIIVVIACIDMLGNVFSERNFNSIIDDAKKSKKR